MCRVRVKTGVTHHHFTPRFLVKLRYTCTIRRKDLAEEGIQEPHSDVRSFVLSDTATVQALRCKL